MDHNDISVLTCFFHKVKHLVIFCFETWQPLRLCFLIDPLDWTTVTAVFISFTYTLSVRKSASYKTLQIDSKSSSEKNVNYYRDCGAGRVDH